MTGKALLVIIVGAIIITIITTILKLPIWVNIVAGGFLGLFVDDIVKKLKL